MLDCHRLRHLIVAYTHPVEIVDNLHSNQLTTTATTLNTWTGWLLVDGDARPGAHVLSLVWRPNNLQAARQAVRRGRLSAPLRRRARRRVAAACLQRESAATLHAHDERRAVATRLVQTDVGPS